MGHPEKLQQLESLPTTDLLKEALPLYNRIIDYKQKLNAALVDPYSVSDFTGLGEYPSAPFPTDEEGQQYKADYSMFQALSRALRQRQDIEPAISYRLTEETLKDKLELEKRFPEKPEVVERKLSFYRHTLERNIREMMKRVQADDL